MGAACGMHWGRREEGKHDRKRPSGVPRHRWEDNIKVDHKAVGWAVVD